MAFRSLVLTLLTLPLTFFHAQASVDGGCLSAIEEVSPWLEWDSTTLSCMKESDAYYDSLSYLCEADESGEFRYLSEAFSSYLSYFRIAGQARQSLVGSLDPSSASVATTQLQGTVWSWGVNGYKYEVDQTLELLADLQSACQ